MLNLVGLIPDELITLITSIARNMGDNDDPLRPTLSFYFVRRVEALAVYDLMDEYIRSSKLLNITN